jgi:nitrite reductase/ring-hydroxylating ferredoxin subunit
MAEALAERGPAHSFGVLLHGQPVPAFALRFEGQVVAYLNRCAHVPVEMDWQPGQFLDQDKRWIICSIHGAVYEPANGQCVSGPCRGANLRPLHVTEQDGQVWWWPQAPLAAQTSV